MANRICKLLVVAAFALASLPVWAGETHVVIAKDMVFEPEELTIQAGDTVRWENHERRQYHNVWFREAGEDPVPYFFPEESYEKTFDEPGVYPYVCEPHEQRGMKGVITVE